VKTKIIEAMNGPNNWGKFLLGQFDTEWERSSAVLEAMTDPLVVRMAPLLRQCGWDKRNILVLDLQTGEGSIFAPWGSAAHDLNDKHQVWVCPLFEPFLVWLYAQDLRDLDKLPDLVTLDTPFAMHGYRRARKVVK
jgi:hypothetical protein